MNKRVRWQDHGVSWKEWHRGGSHDPSIARVDVYISPCQYHQLAKIRTKCLLPTPYVQLLKGEGDVTAKVFTGHPAAS